MRRYELGIRKLKGPATVEGIDRLRNDTPIGTYIEFKRSVSESVSTTGLRGISKGDLITVSGIVTKKFPNIFMLDNGKTYSWKDYMLGKDL